MLKLFLRLSTTPELVSSVGADLVNSQIVDTPLSASREDKLVAAWMLSSKAQPIVSSGAGKTPSKRRSVPSGDRLGEGDEGRSAPDARSHLSMLLPMCLDLVLAQCNAPELKSVSVSLIK